EKTIFDSMMVAKYEKIAQKKYINLSDGSKVLTLLTKTEKKEKEESNLFIIPGWGSIVLGWDDFLMEARKHFNLVYLETREKKSSFLAKKTKNNLNRLSSDIQEVMQELHLDPKKTIIFSSSYGSVLHAHALATKKIQPYLSIMVGPVPKIDMPPTFRYLIHILPIFFFRVFQPLGEWWVKKAKSEDPLQAAKYLRVIKEAEPKKWKKVGKHISLKTFWDIYAEIDAPVLIVDESKDKMHNTERTKKIQQLIKDSKYIDLQTNKFTHSSDAVKVIIDQIASFFD
ncbi:MAG: hypothetical protein ACTSUR_05175, partial [Candidatus Heimdallarchaeaceae archaeon]